MYAIVKERVTSLLHRVPHTSRATQPGSRYRSHKSWQKFKRSYATIYGISRAIFYARLGGERLLQDIG